MELIIVKDNIEGGKKAFELIKEGMNQGAKVLGLATGSTPITLYHEMIQSDVDFSEMTALNLDEYVGLAPTDSQSYHYFMDQELFLKNHLKKHLYQMVWLKTHKKNVNVMIKLLKNTQLIFKF